MALIDFAAARPPKPALAAPSRRVLLTIGALCALALWVIAVRSPSFDTSSSDADESLFLLIGGHWLHGQLPYETIWDVKPPGLFALFAMAQWVVGPGILAARLLSAAAVFATSCALFRFADNHLGGRALGVAAAILYPFYTLILYGLRSRPELLFAPLVVLGLDLALTQWTRRQGAENRAVALSGLLFGCAVMLKQTAVFEALLAAGFVSLKPGADWFARFNWRAFLIFGLAGAVPTAGFLAYFATKGVDPSLYLAPFIGASHRLSGDGISVLDGALRFLPMLKPILPLVLGGLLLLTEWRVLKRSDDAVGIRALGLWVLASSSGILAMRSMYFQYFCPLIPPLLLASLVVIRAGLLKMRTAGVRLSAAAALCLPLALYPIGWLLCYERYEAVWTGLPAKVAETLRTLGLKPGDSLYVPDQETTIYLLADAQIPTRFPQSQHLVCDFSLPGVGQSEEIRRIMASRPRFIVVAHNRSWMVCERPDRLAIVDAALTRDYTRQAIVTENGQSVDVYCRSGTCWDPEIKGTF